jgi:hypothetical protein
MPLEILVNRAGEEFLTILPVGITNSSRIIGANYAVKDLNRLDITGVEALFARIKNIGNITKKTFSFPQEKHLMIIQIRMLSSR